jgi:hypothetical protein
MTQVITAPAEDTVSATGASGQSTLVPIENEPAPRLIVEPLRKLSPEQFPYTL